MSTHVAPAAGVPKVGTATGLPARVVVSNETDARLSIRGDGGTRLVLAPLERRALGEDEVAPYASALQDLVQREEVAVAPEPPADNLQSTLFVFAFWAGAAYLAYGLVTGRGLGYWAGGAALLAALGLLILQAARSHALDRWAAQFASVCVVVLVGFAAPAAAIYWGANLPDVGTAALGRGVEQERAILTLIGRGLQVLFIAAASLLPALLFFLFDRHRLETLRSRFERHVFRLDSSVQTRADIQAKYGSLMDEAYGPKSRAAATLQPGTRLPILVATVLITFGWILVLLNPEVEVVRKSRGMTALFEPWDSPLAFGFLGAYFFALGSTLRGYVRGDLRPKAYSYIAVRIVIVVILSWVLGLTGPDDSAGILIAAFAVGVVPETLLYRLRELPRTGVAGHGLDVLIEPQPLTDLQGIDLYDRARLESEGVTNVQALAKHDLVELMLQTQIPVPRLVDWTDQAILYLHLGGDAKDLDVLRSRGIRTATDLRAAHAEAAARSEQAERDFLALLGGRGEPRLRTIVNAIGDEEWIAALGHWHGAALVVPELRRYPEDYQDEVAVAPA
jgi:hypothetical protein